jgi:hypothetical protein
MQMSRRKPQILVRIKYIRHIASDDLIKVLRAMDNSVLRTELDELRAVSEEFPELPRIIYDASEARILRYSGRAFLIKQASEGSIILTGAAVGIAYWVLQNTIGETLKETYLESDLQFKIKKLFKTRIDDKAKSLVSHINKSIRQSFKGQQPECEISYKTEDDYVTFEVDINLSNKFEENMQYFDDNEPE